MRLIICVLSRVMLGCGPSNLYVRQSSLKVLKSGHPGGPLELSDALDSKALKTLRSCKYFQTDVPGEGAPKLLALRFERDRGVHCGNPFILHGLTFGILPAYVPELYLMEFVVKDQGKLYRYEYQIRAARRHTWGEAFWTPKYTPEQVKRRLLVDAMLRKGIWARKEVKALELYKKSKVFGLINIEN